jgi:hypothetical protein
MDCLNEAIFLLHIVQPQPFTIALDFSVQHPPVIYAGHAMAAWE